MQQLIRWLDFRSSMVQMIAIFIMVIFHDSNLHFILSCLGVTHSVLAYLYSNVLMDESLVCNWKVSNIIFVLQLMLFIIFVPLKMTSNMSGIVKYERV